MLRAMSTAKPRHPSREATVDALHAGKLDLVTNVALFTEGLDVPLLGIVIVLGPTQSLTLHLQMLGRVTRTARGKRRGLILDHAGNSLRHGLYDFEHQWSLEGRPKKSSEPLLRRCPECGAMLPINAQNCSECGFEFVVQMRRPRMPEVAAGDLEQIDADDISDHQLRAMPDRELLLWCRDDPLRPRRAHLVRRKADGSR
jgi:superfamily II DNA or RNA helicase